MSKPKPNTWKTGCITLVILLTVSHGFTLWNNHVVSMERARRADYYRRQAEAQIASSNMEAMRYGKMGIPQFVFSKLQDKLNTF